MGFNGRRPQKQPQKQQKAAEAAAKTTEITNKNPQTTGAAQQTQQHKQQQKQQQKDPKEGERSGQTPSKVEGNGGPKRRGPNKWVPEVKTLLIIRLPPPERPNPPDPLSHPPLFHFVVMRWDFGHADWFARVRAQLH